MTVYEISVEHHEGESLNMAAFKRELQRQINADAALIEQVKAANIAFAEKLQQFCANPENAAYAGTAVKRCLEEAPRYVYVKNIAHSGKLYDVQIDQLFRVAQLIEIGEEV